MPLYRPISFKENTALGLWNIEEDYDDLFDKVQYHGFDVSIISPYKSELKRIQWLAARILLHELQPNIKKIYYHQSGAPYLENGTFISMSHSHKMVAVQLDKLDETGVDIQYFSQKIMNIKEKFASKFELNFLNKHQALDQLRIIWSAKEAIYKKMKIEGLIFNKEIEIAPFDYGQKGWLEASVNHKSIHTKLNLKYEILGDYTLVYTSIP